MLAGEAGFHVICPSFPFLLHDPGLTSIMRSVSWRLHSDSFCGFCYERDPAVCNVHIGKSVKLLDLLFEGFRKAG